MSKPLVLAETTAVLELLAAQNGPHLADMEASAAREVYHQLGELFEEPACSTIRTVDFAGPTCPMRAYFPSGNEGGPVIVYMHGGGWVIGDLETHHALCALIAEISGIRVVAVDYRLAPECAYPTAHEDCLAAAKFIAGSPAELETPVAAIAVAGDSAGGNLAYYVAARMGGKKVVGQLLIYPVLDCTSPAQGSYQEFAEGYLLDRRLMDRFIDDYLPDGRYLGHLDVSPLLHDLPSDLPSAVVLTAGLDPLRDQGRALAAAMVSQGTQSHYLEAEGLIHGLATMRKAFPSADKFIRRSAAIFAEMIRSEIAKNE